MSTSTSTIRGEVEPGSVIGDRDGAFPVQGSGSRA